MVFCETMSWVSSVARKGPELEADRITTLVTIMVEEGGLHGNCSLSNELAVGNSQSCASSSVVI